MQIQKQLRIKNTQKVKKPQDTLNYPIINQESNKKYWDRKKRYEPTTLTYIGQTIKREVNKYTWNEVNTQDKKKMEWVKRRVPSSATKDAVKLMRAKRKETTWPRNSAYSTLKRASLLFLHPLKSMAFETQIKRKPRWERPVLDYYCVLLYVRV